MIDQNAPAMPSYALYNEEGELVNTYQSGCTTGRTYGLTIRQQFAMAAMQGISANRWAMESGNYTHEELADLAVHRADALIDRLNK